MLPENPFVPFALSGLAVAVLLLVLLRRRRRHVEPDPVQPAGNEAARLRPQTALSDLRDMREALGPATHNRIERRRNPQPGAVPKIERRRRGVRRGPE